MKLEITFFIFEDGRSASVFYFIFYVVIKLVYNTRVVCQKYPKISKSHWLILNYSYFNFNY